MEERSKEEEEEEDDSSLEKAKPTKEHFDDDAASEGGEDDGKKSTSASFPALSTSNENIQRRQSEDVETKRKSTKRRAKTEPDPYGQHHCKECDKVFSDRKKLHGHNHFVHRIQIHVCEFCSKEFKNKTACKQHVRNVHEAAMKEGEVCPVCSKVFKSKALLDCHTRAVHDTDDNLFCHVCATQCKNLYALKKHVRKCELKPKRAPKHFVPGNKVGHPGYEQDTHYDEDCDRTYLNYKAFRVHNHNSHTDDPMPCRICESVLKSRDGMRQHYVKKHGITDKEVLKDLTGAGFAKRGHPLEKSDLETCPTCGQVYSQKYFLRHHRARCASGRISTLPPLQPGFSATLTPQEMLARYAVPKPQEQNGEQVRKREATLARWRELEEEQLRHRRVGGLGEKRKVENDGDEARDSSEEEADLQEGMDSFEQTTDNSDEEEEVKEEVEDEEMPMPDVKLEVEDDSNDTDEDDNSSLGEEDNIVNFSEDHKEYGDDETDVDLKPRSLEIPIKFDPINPPDWRQFNHLAGQGEKVEKIAFKPVPIESNPKVPKNLQEGRSKENEPVTCTHCDKSYTSTKGLNAHIRSTHAELLVTCPNCDRSLKNRTCLQMHLQKKHRLSKEAAREVVRGLALEGREAVVAEVLACGTCIQEGKPHRTYKNRSHLNTHIVNWHDLGTYLCVTCGEDFDLRGKLRNHNNSYHSESESTKSGACPHCGKVVKRVKRHIQEVHGEKEECVCPVCARVFHGIKPMRDHVRHNHDNEGKVFICHLCSKEVSNELNLKQHLRRQHYQMPSPEDYISCADCGKAFPTELSLKSHNKAVHEADARKCDICGGTYKNKYSLTKHMKNAHFGHLSTSKVGKGSYRMANTPRPTPPPSKVGRDEEWSTPPPPPQQKFSYPPVPTFPHTPFMPYYGSQ